MNYVRRSRFVFGTSDWTTELPARPWTPADFTVGGSRTSAAGVAASYVVRRDALMRLPLRVSEDEWPDLLALVAYGQTSESFTWYPDADEPDTIQVVLEFPLSSEPWEPGRMGGFERVFEFTLTLRAVPSLTPSVDPYREYFTAGAPGIPDPGPGLPESPPPDIEPGPEPEPEPEPGPPDDPPAELLFFDDFSGGNLSGDQNGVGWRGTNTGSQDSVGIVADATNPSGYALGFTYGGNPNLSDDAWAEKRIRLPDLTTCYVEMRLSIPVNYVHRNATGADNNKMLRLWDEVYNDSIVHVGMSTLPRPAGNSQLIGEYTKAGSTTGNHGIGPWTTVFNPGTVYDIGFEVTVAAGLGIANGRMRIWVNDVLVLDRADLDMCTTSSDVDAANVIRNGYLLGWANSGFTETTVVKLQRLIVATARVEI